MNRTRTFVAVLTLAFVLLAPSAMRTRENTLVGSSVAECDEPSCRAESARLDRPARLRALSLDLRGHVPTLEEMQSLSTTTGDEIPAELLSSWLESDTFAERTVRRHRELLWNNLANVRFVHLTQRVSPAAASLGTRRWYRTSAAREIRPNDAQCDDREDTLLAQPFDLTALKLTGAPIPIARGVQRLLGEPPAMFSASENGLYLRMDL